MNIHIVYSIIIVLLILVIIAQIKMLAKIISEPESIFADDSGEDMLGD